jgi:hypothetical protein
MIVKRTKCLVRRKSAVKTKRPPKMGGLRISDEERAQRE